MCSAVGAVDLAGLVVRDDAFDDGPTVSESLVLPPGGYVVVVANRLGAEQAGLTADYACDDVQLTDGSDDPLVTEGSAVIDRPLEHVHDRLQSDSRPRVPGCHGY